MILLTRLALEVGERRGVLSPALRRAHEADLAALPGEIETILNEHSGLIRAAAYRHAHVQNWLFLGRGVYYPIALESALKMKEVTYIHAEGMAAGFLKHGTLSLVDDKLGTLVFVPPPATGDLHAMTMSSVEEVKARGGFVFGFTFEPDDDLFDEQIVLSTAHPLAAPFLPLVAAQLLAYFTATALKRNVDKPRSLAKSVTVA
jgi:glucosamine--fructose-6-phosphate aminotransferase (isomerizing)